MSLEADFIKKIQALENAVLKDKQQANNIVKLLKILAEAKKEVVVFLVIKSLQRIFTHFIENEDFVKTYDVAEVKNMYKNTKGGKRKHKGGEEEGDDDEVEEEGPSKKKTKVEGKEGVENGKQNGSAKKSPEEVFSTWLLSLYDKYITKLLSLLWREEVGIQSCALDALFHFAKLESRMQSKILSTADPVLQPHLMIKILEKVITYPESNPFLLDTFCTNKLKKYKDVQYITYWIFGHSNLLSNKGEESYPYEAAVHQIISSIRKSNKFWMKTEVKDEKDEKGSDNENEGEEETEKEIGGKAQRRLADRLNKIDWLSMNKERAMKSRFSEAWLKFLTLELSQEMIKMVLRKMDVLLPQLVEPFMMMDFLNQCYAKGGIFSILALNGIFIEITKFNLDFPQFYKRLYSLFDTGVLHTRHRAEFFKLATRFMFSKYLPSYTAAAFVKRIMRIALTAPPAGCIIAMAFAHNVMQLHPSIQVLVHRASMNKGDEDEEREKSAPVLLIGSALGSGVEDPFDMDHSNPAQCSAINSSLWELLPLMSHQSPTVSKMALAFNGPLNQPPYNMDDVADASYSSLFMASQRDIPRTTPTNFIPRRSLFDAPVAGWVLPKQ